MAGVVASFSTWRMRPRISRKRLSSASEGGACLVAADQTVALRRIRETVWTRRGRESRSAERRGRDDRWTAVSFELIDGGDFRGQGLVIFQNTLVHLAVLLKPYGRPALVVGNDQQHRVPVKSNPSRDSRLDLEKRPSLQITLRLRPAHPRSESPSKNLFIKTASTRPQTRLLRKRFACFQK